MEQLEKDLDPMRGLITGLKKHKNKTGELKDPDDFICRTERQAASANEARSKRKRKTPQQEEKEPSVIVVSHMSIRQRLRFPKGHSEYKNQQQNDGGVH